MKLTDEQLTARLESFVNDQIKSGEVDHMFIITNRNDRVGLHSSNGSMKSLFAALEIVLFNKDKYLKAGDEE